MDISASVSSDRERQIIEMFNDLGDKSLPGRMGIRIVAASPDRVVGTMPVEGNTQPYGLLHGGASCVLAETLGSLGSALQAGPGRVTVGIEINATHHRAVRSGLVTGVATLAHSGRTMSTFDITITDEDDRRVCTARLSCLQRRGAGRPGTRLMVRPGGRRRNETAGTRRYVSARNVARR